jgi:hypothetical protein
MREVQAQLLADVEASRRRTRDSVLRAQLRAALLGHQTLRPAVGEPLLYELEVANTTGRAQVGGLVAWSLQNVINPVADPSLVLSMAATALHSQKQGNCPHRNTTHNLEHAKHCSRGHGCTICALDTSCSRCAGV